MKFISKFRFFIRILVIMTLLTGIGLATVGVFCLVNDHYPRLNKMQIKPQKTQGRKVMDVHLGCKKELNKLGVFCIKMAKDINDMWGKGFKKKRNFEWRALAAFCNYQSDKIQRKCSKKLDKKLDTLEL